MRRRRLKTQTPDLLDLTPPTHPEPPATTARTGGPKTEAGRAIARMNATSHGMDAKVGHRAAAEGDPGPVETAPRVIACA